MRLLSYPLGPETPTFLENPPVTFKQVCSVAEGGVANWYEINTINHNGTHIDVPFHYWQDGPTLTDLPLDDFIFTQPFLVDIPKGDGELIRKADLEPYAEALSNADLLLIRTGTGSYRNEDPVRYGRRSPGFYVDAAEALLAPTSSLRAVAFDFPSASSPMWLDEGNEFHREILGATGRGRYLLLIEDARIDADLEQSDLRRVLVAPLFLTNLDAAPCTILAES